MFPAFITAVKINKNLTLNKGIYWPFAIVFEAAE